MNTPLIQGPLAATLITETILEQENNVESGAHSIFLGRIRADKVNGKSVAAIDYSAYTEMALESIKQIQHNCREKFDIQHCTIYHSTGTVKTGELCFFVFTSSKRRAIAQEACTFLVEEVKQKVPIFGKELFEDNSHQWKVNT